MHPILTHFSSKFPPGDWRQVFYAEKNWKVCTLKRDFKAGKQGVTLAKGTEVLARSVAPGQVTILHDQLLCMTNLGPKHQTYVDL